MSRYFPVVVLVVFACVLHGTAQEEPVHMPVIDCVVEYTHGSLNYTPKSSDTISLDLNAIDKISLDFESKRSGRSHIPHGRFRVLGVDESLVYPHLHSLNMNLVSSGPDRKVTIYIDGISYAAGRPPDHFQITIITETSRSIGVVILTGTARDPSGVRKSN